MQKILVVDDERAIRNTMHDILVDEGYVVDIADDGQAALDMSTRIAYDLIITDLKMPHLDGLELLRRLHDVELAQSTPVVMISGHADIDTAVEALKMGAYDFIVKPVDLNRLLIVVRHALENHALHQQVENQRIEVGRLKQQISGKNQLVGESAAISHVRDIIQKVAPTEARVLVTGPNGTGKEIVARMLHELSSRASGPMVEVNCAAIPGELIESELFGHTKGSFTGAVKDRAGKFEQADGGTLFLDEVGDMSLSAQAKVLRALQEQEITRVGSDKTIHVDVRVIAATNKDLQHEIEEGRFREDLYHRLCVIPIALPPLDERLEDIPLLVDVFLRQIEQEGCSAHKPFTPEAIEALQRRRWPGNIRQLRNVVERLYILGAETEITDKDVELYA